MGHHRLPPYHPPPPPHRLYCDLFFIINISALHRKINGGAGLVFEVSCVFDGFEIRITLVLTWSTVVFRTLWQAFIPPNMEAVLSGEHFNIWDKFLLLFTNLIFLLFFIHFLINFLVLFAVSMNRPATTHPIVVPRTSKGSFFKFSFKVFWGKS